MLESLDSALLALGRLDIVKATGLFGPTAGKALESLQQLRIIREITGRQRSRVYVYGQYLDMLNISASET